MDNMHMWNSVSSTVGSHGKITLTKENTLVKLSKSSNLLNTVHS